MKLKSLTPIAEVESVTRSIEFYSKLGFEAANTFTAGGASEPTWASLPCGPIQYLFYARKGEFEVKDPDGTCS